MILQSYPFKLMQNIKEKRDIKMAFSPKKNKANMSVLLNVTLVPKDTV